MIFPDQAVRIVIATKPVDFRKGHDGLASMAQAELGFAPKAGVMVVFRSKRGDRAHKRVDDINLGLTGDFRDSVATGAVNTFDVGVSAGRLDYRGGIPAGVDDDKSFTKLNFASPACKTWSTASSWPFCRCGANTP